MISTIGFRSSAIEWRFAATSDAFVANNLTNGPLSARNDAGGTDRNNVTAASLDWFRNVSGDGDLRLTRQVDSVVHRGEPIADVTIDLDSRARADTPDIGAYEY